MQLISIQQTKAQSCPKFQKKIKIKKIKANATVHNNWVCYSFTHDYINLQCVGRTKMVMT